MQIKIHFDDIIYQLQRAGGISTYWREITSRIINYQNFQINHTRGSKLTRYFPILSTANIFHSSYYRINLLPKTKTVVTVHDFLYELGFIQTLGRRINQQQIKWAIQAADAIVCVSNNTQSDLLKLYPNLVSHPHIHVVAHGRKFNYKNDEQINKKLVSTRIAEFIENRKNNYLLFVGKRAEYKNFKNALLAFAKSRLPKTGYLMVCVGSKFSDAEEQLIASFGLQHKIIAIDNVSDRELQHLYHNAFALVYPSLYEGFGLPPLEAMSCGCPVIASNTSSIPEVVGDAGISIEPRDITAIINALEKLLDARLRSSYIAKGLARAELFSWDEAARKHIEIYQSLMKV